MLNMTLNEPNSTGRPTLEALLSPCPTIFIFFPLNLQLSRFLMQQFKMTFETMLGIRPRGSSLCKATA